MHYEECFPTFIKQISFTEEQKKIRHFAMRPRLVVKLLHQYDDEECNI